MKPYKAEGLSMFVRHSHASVSPVEVSVFAPMNYFFFHQNLLISKTLANRANSWTIYLFLSLSKNRQLSSIGDLALYG